MKMSKKTVCGDVSVNWLKEMDIFSKRTGGWKRDSKHPTAKARVIVQAGLPSDSEGAVGEVEQACPMLSDLGFKDRHSTLPRPRGFPGRGEPRLSQGHLHVLSCCPRSLAFSTPCHPKGTIQEYMSSRIRSF